MLSRASVEHRRLVAFTLVLTLAGLAAWVHALPTIGPAASTPAYVTAAVATPVVMTVQIIDPSLIPGGVNLLKTDATGRTLAIVGVMRDDGTNGDAVAGDQTFSLRVTVNEPAVGESYYRASAAFRGVLQRTISSPTIITVLGKPTITVSLPPAPASGWYTSAVIAHFACTEPGNGIVTCPADQVIDSDGANQTVTGTTTDKAGKSASVTSLPFSLDKSPPMVQIMSPLNGAVLAISPVTVEGIVTDTLSGVMGVRCNGQPAVVSGLGFTCSVLLPDGANTISAEANDVAGNRGEAHVSVNMVSTPPGAPPLDTTAVTGLARATEFLYTGLDAIQKGVVPGTIDAKRAAVLQGRVLDRAGLPLPGVAVSVHHHSEFGTTLTRLDGKFDMAVNGGGVLTIDYKKTDYLPARRQSQVPWEDFATVPDVILVQPDPNVTAVDFSPGPASVARGSVVTDADGSRQATLIFAEGGTMANMELPDGTILRAQATLHVRATEYTDGPNGPRAMPANLPPTSGYTYTVELSADEAATAGATRVTFVPAVSFYVENFLGFPVGGIAPVGFYDRGKAAWVASENGRVIKVLRITNGLAELDIDGSGNAAGATALAALGATDGERQRVATLYAPGQSLWRMPVSHFSSLDVNWPYRPDCEPAVQSCEPDQPPPQDDDPLDDPNDECSSVIGCENQTLGESVSISGTPFGLHYRSDRTPDRKSAYTLSIPLSGATAPATLKRIDLVVSVAGQQFKQSFPAAINQRTTWTWDGRDAYGRSVQGQRPVSVRIGYAYGAIKLQPSEGSSQAFAALSASGLPVSANITRQEVSFWQEWRSSLGPWDARAAGLGGWTLSVHHAYDPAGRVLHLGYGGRRTARHLPDVITTVAGHGNDFCFGGPCGDGGPATEAQLTVADIIAVEPDGSIDIPDRDGSRIRRVRPDGIITTIVGGSGPGYTGDGGPATAARVRSPQGVAIGPDGSLYIADTGNSRIRRLGLDGIISTVAGNGSAADGSSASPPGDGGPAVQAQVSQPRFITVGPDGSLYVADSAYYRIRKVSPDGVITTLAGTGQRCVASTPCGDGGQANQATLLDPNGIALGPDGSLYITDTNAGRIRRVAPDGRISTVAGRIAGSNGFAGDGGPASDALFNVPRTVAVGPDGSLYIADENNLRVRRVGPDGIITTIAGTGTASTGTIGTGFIIYGGDAGPAAQAQIAPNHALLGPDGSLYIWGTNMRRVRRVAPILSGFTAGDLVVAAEDGREIYVFDNGGRHLRTLDALTGAVRYQFGYGAGGYLTSATDGSDNVTTIERAGAAPAAIIAPGGQRTALSVDGDGWLLSATNPAGEAHTMSSSVDGLLRNFIDPLGNIHSFTYDAFGRLIKDEDPVGGSTSLARTEQRNGYTVTTTSALGRSHVYQVEQLPIGAVRRTVTASSGAKTVTVISADASAQTTTNSDGSVITIQDGPDPRWGMLAPVATSVTLQTPRGLTRTITTTRTARLSDPLDLFSLATLTDTETDNGVVSRRVYDGATRSFTIRTAAGRMSALNVDVLGRVTQEQIAGLAPVGYAYTNRGLLSAITQGSGATSRTTRFMFNGARDLTGVTDALGQTMNFAYDIAGRPVTQTLPDGRTLQYAYDAAGNATTITPPGRPAHSIAYTPIDQMSSYTPPNVGVGSAATEYTYDADRALTRLTRPDGQFVNLTYDEAGRTGTLDFARGSLRYTYNVTTGRLTGVTAPGGIGLGYGYDGSLLTGAAWAGPVSGSIGYSYDNNFRLTTETVNAANSVSFVYDADGLLIKAGSLDLIRDAQNGSLFGTALGGITDSTTYNNLAELTDYSAAYGGSGIYRATYTLDAIGRISQKAETVGGIPATYGYTYDAAGRLSSAKKNGFTSTYSYDSNGNRTSVTGPSGTVNAIYDNQDRLLAYGSAIYSYTANGDLLSKTVGGQITSYQYDALGNLRSATLPGQAIEYLIDGSNRRIGKKVNGVLVQAFLYQGQLRPVAELNAAGSIVSRFVYATRINVPDYMIKGGGTYRIVTDHLGSPRLVIDTATGTIAQRMDYDEFGQVLIDTNPGFQPFGFAGGLYDRDLRLVRFGARDYDAETGRWTAKDPIGLSGGMNVYAYVDNNPVYSTDATGMYLPPPIGPALPLLFAFRVGLLAGTALNYLLEDSIQAALTRFLPAEPPAQLTPDLYKKHKQLDYDKYKERCIQKTPLGLDKCEAAKWRAARARDCAVMRAEWDRRYSLGEHDASVSQAYAEEVNALKDVQKYCPPVRGCN